MKNRLVQFLLLFSVVMPASAIAGNPSDYLILQDIGPYKLEKPFVTSDGLVIGGGEPKSSRDGNKAEGLYDCYAVGYDGGDNLAGPNVEVRVYDSTQWMLHNLEEDQKDEVDGVSSKTHRAAATEVIDNNRLNVLEIGGRSYSWVSGNKAIIVSYHDMNFQYPVPMEVISAYLKKYPSTLPATYQIRLTAQEKQWIKEEFDRLLWVSDRWVTLIREADPKLKDKLGEAADNLAEFARYRRVYFKPLFGDPMAADIELLETSHMRPGQEEFIRAKLAEYKEWWAAHKSDSIHFP